ncbi:short-chain dehydrogenase/reductase [Mycobacterium sp. ACS1612]|uniref:oxidoreductase n=1 Tax=Mycobacterium sp. ACS1612 TaxID=1834117 RepID=UPI0008010F04|nr:oxidoreductase [Mycobacterium sp. ACS1612]OBF41005.1 short-chain dehydrogenase/reductase [Mycobacterium sp. ACS1612]
MSKVWFITGSSRGFGAELVRAVLAHGDRVVATARRPEQLRALVEGHEDQARVFGLDVTDADAAVAAMAFAVAEFGRIDVVVNNAGYANSAAIEETDSADFRAQIEANLFGVVNVTRAALPVLRAQRSGVFVQFSSIGGRVGGTPGLGAYQAAKFGVEGFSEVLANEVSAFGVKVIIVEPGGFRTDWMGSSMTMHDPGPDYRDALEFMHELRRNLNGNEPGDPARAARIIIDVVETPEPPRRLLLGSDAVELALASGAQRDEEARKWAAVSRSADFPE